MSPFDLPSTGKSADWLIFIAILLAVGIGIACFILWVFMFRKSGGKAKRKRRSRHHRKHNPTLSESGGLPPKRDANQPPPGP